MYLHRSCIHKVGYFWSRLFGKCILYCYFWLPGAIKKKQLLQKFTYHSVYFSQIFHFKISWSTLEIWSLVSGSNWWHQSPKVPILPVLIFCTSSNYDLVIGGRIFSGHHSLLLPIHATTCNRNYITKGESTRSGFSVIFFI